MSKLVFALDLDDFLADNAPATMVFLRDQGYEHLNFDDYRDDWKEMIPEPQEEIERLKELFFFGGTVENMAPIEGAHEGVEKMLRIGEVIIVTARRDTAREVTAAWIGTHFEDLISRIEHMTTIDGFGEKHIRPKASICIEISASHLFDDHPKHCNAVAIDAPDTQPVLFGDGLPWHSGHTIHPRVLQFPTWSEINNYTDSLRAS